MAVVSQDFHNNRNRNSQDNDFSSDLKFLLKLLTKQVKQLNKQPMLSDKIYNIKCLTIEKNSI